MARLAANTSPQDGGRPRPGFKAPLGWQARHSLVRATPAGSAEGAHSICILRVQFLKVIM